MVVVAAFIVAFLAFVVVVFFVVGWKVVVFFQIG